MCLCLIEQTYCYQLHDENTFVRMDSIRIVSSFLTALNRLSDLSGTIIDGHWTIRSELSSSVCMFQRLYSYSYS